MAIQLRQILVTASLAFIVAYAVVLFSPYVLLKMAVGVYGLLTQRGHGRGAAEGVAGMVEGN